VEGVSIDGLPTPVDLNKAQALTLPAKSLMEIGIRIPFILKAATTKPYTLAQTIPIPAATYQLAIHLALVADSRVNQVKLMRIPRVAVSYAP
jgi:hypothetical protein